jgi:UDP-glucuronate decarboxylase
MRRVLVIGGAGLVGSHLVDRLLADGNEVIALDDLSRGSFANLAHLKRERRFAFVEHDVATPFRARVDSVFHLAVPSTRAACEPEPGRAALTCVTGTLHALELAAATGARLVVVTSTERWGAGAVCAESLALDFARSGAADVRLVRAPSVYGPRMAPDGAHLVTSLVLQALRGEPLAPRVPLDRRVRLAYATDVVEVLSAAMEGERDGGTPIVAGGAATTVGEVARLIAEAAGREDATPLDLSDPVEGPTSGPTSEVLHGVEAASLVASVELAEGLARTVAWFARRLGRSSGIVARAAASLAPSRRVG